MTPEEYVPTERKLTSEEIRALPADVNPYLRPDACGFHWMNERGTHFWCSLPWNHRGIHRDGAVWP